MNWVLGLRILVLGFLSLAKSLGFRLALGLGLDNHPPFEDSNGEDKFRKLADLSVVGTIVR